MTKGPTMLKRSIPLSSLLAASLAAGACDPAVDDGTTPATGDDFPPESRHIAVDEWMCEDPELFGAGSLSSPADEGGLSLSRNGRRAFFHRADDSGRLRLMTARLHGDEWGTPDLLPFSGEYNDLDPFLTHDGRWLYFASDRPVDGVEARSDFDLWRVRRRCGGRWGSPQHLGETVNTDAQELYPTLTRDGTLYFNSDRDDGLGGWDIWLARRDRRAFTAPVNAGPAINTEAWEFNPSPSADGRLLFFASMLRPDHEDPDLYFARRVDGAWTPANNLGDCVNTPAGEFHPSLSADGRQLLFVRAGEAGGDFYSIDVDELTGDRDAHR
ncbi:MAG: hypothetical protein B7733_18095 [Myxococcales bacterium FL481]|nr:MAG: hypothetical protein B7733_18095 [Myxococcales bacterium FL481]